jgi:hypothetical protein
MAPGWQINYGPMAVTQLRITGDEIYANSIGYQQAKRKPETKKERIKRIAKERMYSSWSSYNDKTETIKEIKQLHKPRHKVNFMGRRF